MRETGSLKKILEKYEPPPQVCPDYSGKPLGFGSVFTAFGVWCFGFGLGILIFAIESLSTVIGKKRYQARPVASAQWLFGLNFFSFHY